MAMNFNIDEKKRQFVILGFAVSVGALAVWLTSVNVEKTITQETKKLAQDFKAKSKADQEALAGKIVEMNQQLEQKFAAAVEEVKKAIPKEVKGVKEEPKIPAEILSRKVPPGKRAITINVEMLSAVGGLVNPGDYVDLILELDVPNPQKPAGDADIVTSMVFQNLLVVAVDGGTQPATRMDDLVKRLNAKNIDVTLALTPEEASLLTFAQTNGKIILSMRAQNEKPDLQKTDIANWESLSEFVKKTQGTGLLAPQKMPEPEDKRPSVQVFKSGLEY